MLPSCCHHWAVMVNELLPREARFLSSEEDQLFRIVPASGGGKFGRGEQSAGDIDFSFESGCQRPAGAESLLDRGGDLDVCLWIEMAHRVSEGCGAAAL